MKLPTVPYWPATTEDSVVAVALPKTRNLVGVVPNHNAEVA